MRRHIHALITLATELFYCEVCGWWYPPHSH